MKPFETLLIRFFFILGSIALMLSCQKQSIQTPCSFDIYNQPLLIQDIDNLKIPYKGNDRLVFRNVFTQETLLFLPRQESLTANLKLKESSLSITCGNQTQEIFYRFQELRISFIAEDDYILYLYIRPEPLKLEDETIPVFLDVLTIELSKPNYNSGGNLTGIATCMTKSILSFREQNIDTTAIKEFFYTNYAVNLIDNYRLADQSYDEVSITNCSSLREVAYEKNLGLISFKDEYGEQWVVDQQQISDETLIATITFPDPSGNMIAFQSLNQPLKVLYFWASWSIPSRKENVFILKPLYQTWKNQGFEIYGISIDQEKKDWIAAMEDDGLTWKNVNDQGGQASDLLQKLGVEELPYTFLVDEKSQILARGLVGEDLVRAIEKYYEEK